MAEFAELKLAGYRDRQTLSSELAILDVRLLLQFSRTPEASKEEARLVATRQRIAYVAPTHGNYIHSEYSSEPILAEAAASYWAHLTEKHRRRKIPRMLQNHIALGLIRNDDKGKIVAKLLLTLAFDAAVTRRNVRSNKCSKQ